MKTTLESDLDIVLSTLEYAEEVRKSRQDILESFMISVGMGIRRTAKILGFSPFFVFPCQQKFDQENRIFQLQFYGQCRNTWTDRNA